MKWLLNITLACVLLVLVAGCAKQSSLDHPFDMETLYGLSQKQLRDKLGAPSETSNFKSGTIYMWDKGDLSFMASYSEGGTALIFDFADIGPTVHTYETLRQKFNINAKDDRYRVTYSMPDKQTGSVQYAHVRFHWRR